MTPLERWTDERLDDLAAEVHRMGAVVDGIAAMRVELVAVAKDAVACRNNVHKLRNDWMAAAAREQARRVSDRRWMIGTVLTSAALVIAALGIIMNAIG